MSTDRLPDRWATRDYPVLTWIVAQFDTSHPDVQDGTLPDALNISPEDGAAAVRNLERGGYITGVSWMFGDGYVVGDITERALRETGAWPNDQALADQLLWYLNQKVEDAADPETRTRWARIRDGVVGAGRDVAVEMAAAMATRSIGA